MSDTLSACSTVDGYLSRPVKTAGLVSGPKPHLIMPSATLLHVKPATGIIFCINLNFSQPCKGKMFTGVSQGTCGEIQSIGEGAGEREQRKVEEKEIRGKINVTRTRELY